MTRKIIQIAIDRNNTLTALCDDGTLWQEMEGGSQNEGHPGNITYISVTWAKINNVPQYPIEEFCDTTEDLS